MFTRKDQEYYVLMDWKYCGLQMHEINMRKLRLNGYGFGKS